MRNIIKKITVVFMALVLLFSVSACGKSNIDENKIQVYVYVVSDGYGANYMEKLVNDWNSAHTDSIYEFVYEPGQDGPMTLASALETGTADDKNIYVGNVAPYIDELVNDGYLIDISSVYEMEVDGAGNGKIKDKVNNYDKLKVAYADMHGNGMYAVPRTATISPGLVFDYGHFLRRGYLNYATEGELGAVNAQVEGAAKVVSGTTIDTSKYLATSANVLVAEKAFGNYEAGEVILTAGRDGKYGTYDDGQVQTMAEFYALCEKIAVKDYPFIYTTQYATTVTFQPMQHIIYQTIGVDNYATWSSFNGQFKDKEGNVLLNVNKENANLMWGTDIAKLGYNAAAEFFDKTVLGHLLGKNNVNKVLNTRTWDNGPTTSLSHTDAQRGFALDHFYKGDDYGKESAFIFEGGYWENESKNVLSQLAGYGPNGAEHRLYLTPYIEGQITPADQTVFIGSLGGNGMCYLNNYPDKVKTDEDKAAYDDIAKQFIGYCCSDASLNHYTATHGLRACYDYELTTETLSKITPFQKNVFEMLDDTEHVTVVDGTLVGGTKNLFRSLCDLVDFATKVDGKIYTNPYPAMSGMSPNMTYTQWVDGVSNYINDNYSGWLQLVNEYTAAHS